VVPAAPKRSNAGRATGLMKVAASLGLARPGGGSHAAALISALAAFLRRLGTPVRLRDVGLTRDALPEVAAHGMGDWFLRGNPWPVKDVADLL
jgi:alcohol dehydrogenase class IV